MRNLFFTFVMVVLAVGCASKQSTTEPVEPSAPDPVVEAAAPQSVDRTNRYTMDAMIGQVNGRALYANAVLEPIDEQLRALGEKWPRAAFRRRAQPLVIGRLEEILFDSLILGEAQQELTPEENAGLDHIIAYKREELIRQYGQGSAAQADSIMREQTGKGLEQTLKDSRQQFLTRFYFERKFQHKINITRRDIERYYNDHYDEFHSPDKRVLRLIQVSDPQVIDEITQRLAAGEPFTEVVRHPANSRWAERDYEVIGDEPFGDKLAQLNQAMVTLETGQHSPAMAIGGATWWVYLQSIEKGKSQSLQDVQLDIESYLYDMEWRMLTQEYRRTLLTERDMQELDRMAQRLLDITMNRYAKAAGQTDP